MESRGNRIGHASLVLLAACLVAGPLAGGAHAASQGPAVAAKKCKHKRHGQKRKCKRKATMAPASISISPASQDFGIPPPIGKTTRSFTVTNAGGSLAGLPVPIITGQSSDSFAIGSNGCLDALPAGATCQVDVDLFPRGAGVVSATLKVVAVPGGTVTATVTGDVEA